MFTPSPRQRQQHHAEKKLSAYRRYLAIMDIDGAERASLQMRYPALAVMNVAEINQEISQLFAMVDPRRYEVNAWSVPSLQLICEYNNYMASIPGASAYAAVVPTPAENGELDRLSMNFKDHSEAYHFMRLLSEEGVKVALKDLETTTQYFAAGDRTIYRGEAAVNAVATLNVEPVAAPQYQL